MVSAPLRGSAKRADVASLVARHLLVVCALLDAGAAHHDRDVSAAVAAVRARAEAAPSRQVERDSALPEGPQRDRRARELPGDIAAGRARAVRAEQVGLVEQ